MALLFPLSCSSYALLGMSTGVGILLDELDGLDFSMAAVVAVPFFGI